MGNADPGRLWEQAIYDMAHKERALASSLMGPFPGLYKPAGNLFFCRRRSTLADCKLPLVSFARLSVQATPIDVPGGPSHSIGTA